MAEVNSSEDLPQGWILKGRRVKYYMNTSTGQKLYSKDDLMRYVEAQKSQIDQPQPIESAIEKPSNNNEMHRTNDHPEWLPHCWTIELKTQKSGKVYKAYVDPSTGLRFYSKPQVLRYIKTMEQKGSTSKLEEMPKSNVSSLIEYTNEWPEWLPLGWNIELKTAKNGSAKTYKCYIDPSTGRKFFSMPQVLRFLKSVKRKSSTSKRKGLQMSMVPAKKVTIGNSNVEDLPPGWIKKIKYRKSAHQTIKDTFYTDPVNGYVFRSKTDVQRYLKTGDISSCAIKPKKRVEKFLPSSATKRQKLEHPVTRSQLIGGDGSSDVGTMVPLKVYSLRNRTKTVTALTTVPLPVTTEISSYRSDDTELKENSNKSCSGLLVADDLDRKEDEIASADGGLESDSRQELNPDSGIQSEERDSWRKSKHQKWLDLPRRWSKRLAGGKPDLAVNSLAIVELSPEAEQKHVQNVNTARASGEQKELNLPLRTSDERVVSVPDGSVDEVVGVETSLSVSVIDASCHEEANGRDELSDNLSQARRKKTKYNAEQLKILETNFELDHHPRPELRMELARVLGLEPRHIQVWFQNRRVKLKKEQLKKDNGFLQGQIDAIHADNQNLHAAEESGLEIPNEFADVHAGLKDKLQPDKKIDSGLTSYLGEIFADPCLEFAFKTLTGDLPVEESVSTPASNIIGDRHLAAEGKDGNAPTSMKKPTAAKKLLSLPRETPTRAVQVEPRPFVSFDYWSHPSFDSPFKALASSAANKSYFEQQVLPQHPPRDVSSTLPDLGSQNYFQTDISFHFESPEKKQRPAQPPMPINNQPFQFAGSLFYEPPPPPPPVVKENQILGRPRW